MEVNQLEAEIADALDAIRDLERQKARLEETLKHQVCELKAKTTEHDACKYQISKGRILKAETGRLEALVLKAGKEGEQVCDTLDRWKHLFEECNSELHNKYLKAQGHSRCLQREMRRGDSAKPAHGDFERQRAALQSVKTSLDGVKIDTGISLLGNKIGVSGDKIWEDRRRMLVDALPIPQPCYLTS